MDKNNQSKGHKLATSNLIMDTPNLSYISNTKN